MRAMRLVASLLLVSIVLAGCSDDPPSAATQDEGVFAGLDESAEATSTTGAIAGVVVDEAIRPVPRANVTLVAAGKNVTTDDEGRFAFEGLEPGTYFLDAAAHRFAKAQVSADVAAGEVSTVRILIARLTTVEPYQQTLNFEGFIDNYLGYANFVAQVLAPGTLACKCAFEVPVSGNLTTVVMDAIGEVTVENPGTPATVPGDAYWEVLAGGAQGSLRGSSYDEFPLLEHFLSEDFEEDDGTIENSAIGVRITCGVWPCVRMSYDLYVTLWYHEEAPEGWSFIAEKPRAELRPRGTTVDARITRVRLEARRGRPPSSRARLPACP